MIKTIFITLEDNHVLTDAFSVVLGSHDSTYGVKNTITSEIIVSNNTTVTHASIGRYEYDLDIENNTVYTVSWKIVHTIGAQYRYITQEIGPFEAETGIRAITDIQGTFVQGTLSNVLLKITNFDGEPRDAEEITITINDDTNTLVISAVPDKVATGFYVYEWNIDINQTPGKYNVIWSFTVDGISSTELQAVIVVENADDSYIYTSRLANIRSVLDYYIGCSQVIPVYREQARETSDRKIYRFTFPRWNQTPKVKIYRNNKIMTEGVTVDYFHGNVIFDDILLPQDVVQADYTFKWFSEEELGQYLIQAIGMLNTYPPQSGYTAFSLPERYIPAVIHQAATDAIRKLMLCLQFQEPSEVFGGPERAQSVFSNLETLKQNYESKLEKLYDNKKRESYVGLTRSVIVPEFTLPGGRSLQSDVNIVIISTYEYLLDSRVKIENNQEQQTITIKEAFELFHQGKKLFISSHDEMNNKVVFAPIGYIFKSGIKDIFVLNTQKGLSIKSSKEHLFYANNTYKPLEEVKIGDKLISCINGEIVDDFVKEIIDTKEKVEMYDMDVPSTRNLFANGIKCHNSRWFRYLFSGST